MPDHPREARLIPESLTRPQERSEQVKLRRALAFVAMTLVLPGSAQVAVGRRQVGMVALWIWAGVLAVLGMAGLAVVLWRDAVLSLLTNAGLLRVIPVLLVVLGVGWAALLVDAWRLARPPELARRHRAGFAVLNLAAVVAVLGGLVASASVVSTQRELLATVFAGGGDTQVNAGRYNILLLGGDAGKTRVGLRPDSLTVASVDAVTGRTVLLSLPRNLEDAPFPASSPLHKKFPRGFGCPDGSCMLNAIYTYATEHKNLYPGVANPGAQATKEAVEGITGLDINYWVLIDLKGFRQLVDAVGGITVDVNKRVPIGGGSTPITGWIEEGKGQHLDGSHALWFARSRVDSSDYERMARQKCVMNAMLNQLDPLTVLTKFNGIASASKEIVATDIPTGEISTMVDLATKAKAKPVSSLAV
ncbi:MAG: LCP family protein, partial [Actinomycetes bacterium]